MSANNNSVSVPPALAASLRFLERLPAEDRADVEKAIRDQWEEDQEHAQEQAARAAEEEADRLQAEELAADAEAQRQAAALREQEAHVTAAKALVDMVKAHDSTTEAKDKGKKVLQDDEAENTLDLLIALPSQKIRDKIKACEYVDIWHLTTEGMAAATRSKLTGTTYDFGPEGFKLKEDLTGFKKDQDLSSAAWITAVGHYVRIMQLEGVADNIVQSMVRLNHIVTNHPDFEQHGAAIRMWHQKQRTQWVLSSNFRSDGKRFNLGKPNEKHLDELRLRCLEDRTERRIAALGANSHGPSGSGYSSSSGGGGNHNSGGGKRPHSNDSSSSAQRMKAPRTIFRCFVCFSYESGHPYRTCDAKSRVDGKEQFAIRGSGGRIVFADSHKPICIDFQLKGCTTPCRSGAVHRCVNCGVSGHGASGCSA
ncbi:hypothetical protein CF319_g9143 [Tilletia indica]|nr:hypothetical protein CF319_g9143 [Tilletia indica]